MNPDRTLAVKGEKCPSGKKSKERVTGVAFCNWDGSDKRKMVVIGKSANPRCLRGAKSLPVVYQSSQKAWMTNAIFQKILADFDKEMRIKVLEPSICAY